MVTDLGATLGPSLDWRDDLGSLMTLSRPVSESESFLSNVMRVLLVVEELPELHIGSRLNSADFFGDFVSFLRMMMRRLLSTKGSLSQLKKGLSLARYGEEVAAANGQNQTQLNVIRSLIRFLQTTKCPVSPNDPPSQFKKGPSLARDGEEDAAGNGRDRTQQTVTQSLISFLQ